MGECLLVAFISETEEFSLTFASYHIITQNALSIFSILLFPSLKLAAFFFFQVVHAIQCFSYIFHWSYPRMDYC